MHSYLSIQPDPEHLRHPLGLPESQLCLRFSLRLIAPSKFRMHSYHSNPLVLERQRLQGMRQPVTNLRSLAHRQYFQVQPRCRKRSDQELPFHLGHPLDPGDPGVPEVPGFLKLARQFLLRPRGRQQTQLRLLILQVANNLSFDRYLLSCPSCCRYCPDCYRYFRFLHCHCCCRYCTDSDRCFHRDHCHCCCHCFGCPLKGFPKTAT